MKFSSFEQQRLKTRYGLWAIITGASSGIGKEIAARLAEAGLNVLLVARRKALLEQFAEELNRLYSVQTQILEADLSEQRGNRAVIEAAKNLDIGLLVASAGFGTSGIFAETPLESELQMLNVNCASLLTLTHHFAQVFKQRGKGGIILLSSIVGFQGVPFAAHYAATKAYVQTLAEALNLELKPFGVDVLAAAPGPVETGFNEVAGMKMSAALVAEDVGVPILRALGRTTTVFPGFLTKVLVYSLRTAPRALKIRIMQGVMGNMTAHQRLSS